MGLSPTDRSETVHATLDSHLRPSAATGAIVQQSLARDSETGSSSRHLGEEEQDDAVSVHDGPSDHAMTGSYRRPSIVVAAAGPRPTVIQPFELPESHHLTKKEREDVEDEERRLLRDNHILPPESSRRAASPSGSISARISSRLAAPFLNRVVSGDEESALESARASAENDPDERSALLGDAQRSGGAPESPDDVQKKWEEAVLGGKIHTTWQREAQVLAKYSKPLILTFILQYSLPLASVVTVGHIGKAELAAVSLASSTSPFLSYIFHS